MRLFRDWLFVTPLLVLSAADASSHHAFSPVYDANRVITLKAS